MGIWSWIRYRDRLERDEFFRPAPHLGRCVRLLVLVAHWARAAARADDGDAGRSRAFHSHLRYAYRDSAAQRGDEEVVEVRRWRGSCSRVSWSACCVRPTSLRTRQDPSLAVEPCFRNVAESGVDQCQRSIRNRDRMLAGDKDFSRRFCHLYVVNSKPSSGCGA